MDSGGHPFGTDGTHGIERWVNALAFRGIFGSYRVLGIITCSTGKIRVEAEPPAEC